MGLEKLPNELLQQIAGNLNTGSKYALSLTSRRLSTIAYEVLYETTALSGPFSGATN